MYFQKYDPNPLFSDFIDCYFAIDTRQLEGTIEDLIIPDGTFGLIFTDDHKALSRTLNTTSSFVPLKRTSIFGQKTHAVQYTMNPSNSIIFGLKVKPGGISLFTKETSYIKNIFEDIDTLNIADLKEVESQILEASTVLKKIEIIEHYMIQKLKNVGRNADLELFQLMTSFVFLHKGNVRLDLLTTHFNTNYKRIERLFHKYVGMSPKSYLRIIRINACIDVDKFKDRFNLSALAVDNGFFDQSHLTKEFKRVTSLTPKQFFGRDRSFSEVENLHIIHRRWQDKQAV
ncbi:helix-turn-helix domain-containing protein [Flavobacteriaceae bacterium S356]|uniref:Helix-turn-helix domain-containing protein n=1 Tax=Asprobacillus argus TaxID=3076534 RepID=A0ABU3LFB3_9FLAO|nr:helix-turn-helix domain-containing protein [Flavobacteriaceae bacterium S356]